MPDRVLAVETASVSRKFRILPSGARRGFTPGACCRWIPASQSHGALSVCSNGSQEPSVLGCLLRARRCGSRVTPALLLDVWSPLWGRGSVVQMRMLGPGTHTGSGAALEPGGVFGAPALRHEPRRLWGRQDGEELCAGEVRPLSGLLPFSSVCVSRNSQWAWSDFIFCPKLCPLLAHQRVLVNIVWALWNSTPLKKTFRPWRSFKRCAAQFQEE